MAVRQMSAAHGCCATARKTGSNERGDIGGNNGYVDDECGPATTHEQHEHCEPAAQHLARHAAARADVAKRLEVTHTEARLTVHAWHHEQLMRAGQRLAFAKATMHRRLAAIFARNFPLKLLRAPVRLPPFREALQWPASFHMDPALVWLREIIAEVAAEVDRTPAAQMDVLRRRPPKSPPPPKSHERVDPRRSRTIKFKP